MYNIVNKLTELYVDEIDTFKKSFLELNLIDDCTTSRADCLFLYLLIRHHKPKHILEIGTWVGSTLFAIVSACEKNKLPYKIHTIDIQDNLKLKNKYLHSVVVHKGWSFNILQNLKCNFDFIFADGSVDIKTADLLSTRINKNTLFATHDFVPPSDKGIEACHNMIKYTDFKYQNLVMPSYKCNWIYKSKSYANMHDKFSPNYVSSNSFELDDYHNSRGVNNCIAIICPKLFLTSLKLDASNYISAIDFIKPESKSIIFYNGSFLKTINSLYILHNKLIYVNEFINGIPKIKKVYFCRNLFLR